MSEAKAFQLSSTCRRGPRALFLEVVWHGCCEAAAVPTPHQPPVPSDMAKVRLVERYVAEDGRREEPRRRLAKVEPDRFGRAR